jgi:peptide/nickel transport system ATP-binding protein
MLPKPILPEPILVVDALTRHFPVFGGLVHRRLATVYALDDVAFSVREGETLGIVGESGCGKSTLARLLMRLLRPDSGRIMFDGKPVGAPRGVAVGALRRQMQMVFQDRQSSLNPRMTVLDAVTYAPRMHGMPAHEAAEYAEALLQRLGLPPRQFAHRMPHELSADQRQLVAIARALVLQPRLLILDEAIRGLDQSVAAQVLNLLTEFQYQFKLTYLLISRDLNLVEYASDQVLVMYFGRVVEAGPIEKVFGGARHPYTRALLAAKPAFDPDRRSTMLPLSGDPPDPTNPPTGCRFRPRCAFAQDICAIAVPPLASARGGAKTHLVACHIAAAQEALHGV